MKILYVINGLGSGGAENLLSVFIPNVKKQNSEVELLLLSGHDAVANYRDRIAACGVIMHDLKVQNIYSLKCISALRKFFEAREFDIIHVHLFPAMYWLPISLIAKKRCGQLVFTEHSTHNRRWGKPYFRILDSYVYKRYSAIIAITKEIKIKLGAWIPSIVDKITVINNGINLDKIGETKEAERIRFLRERQLKEGVVLLMMTARFELPKSHSFLLHVLNKLPYHYHLLFAGEGNLMSQVQNEARDLNLSERTHFLGFRNDAIALMKMADINILSSKYEGMSGVTLEAMAAGRPFLGSNVSGIQNVVPDDRFLFEHDDADELATRISTIMGNKSLTSSMIVTGLNYVQKYDINKMVSDHMLLYKALTDRRK